MTAASTTNGITNTGNVKTDTLDVTAASTTNGITNTGNVKTDTLDVTAASTTNGITNTGTQDRHASDRSLDDQRHHHPETQDRHA